MKITAAEERRLKDEEVPYEVLYQRNEWCEKAARNPSARILKMMKPAKTRPQKSPT
jgi:hypothetical protein